MGKDGNRTLCDLLGAGLSSLNVSLLTGGTTGAPRRAEMGFAKTRPQHIVRVLPKDHKDDPVPSCGKTLIQGKTMEDRRGIIAQCCDIVVMATGGPGTAHEATVAHNSGVPVIMIQCTGGAAGGQVKFSKREAILQHAKLLGIPPIGANQDTEKDSPSAEEVVHSVVEAIKTYFETFKE